MLHEDPGADGYQEGDVLHGADIGTLVIYLADPGGKGYPEGWFLLEGVDVGTPLFVDLDAGRLEVVDVTEPLEPHLAATATVADQALGVLGVAFDGEGDQSGIYDAPVVHGVLEVDLDLAPPSYVRDEDPDLGMTWATLVHYVYRDLDGSGSFSAGDGLEGDTLCFDGQLVYGLYADPPTRLEGLWWMDVVGLGSGWNLLADAGDGTVVVLEGDDLLNLEIALGTCTL